MPTGSPTPTYKPSMRVRSTSDRETRETASIGGYGVIGTPPTPMPTFMCTGIVDSSQHFLTMVMARDDVPGDRLARVDVDRRAEDGGPGRGHDLGLVVRPHAGEAVTLVLELAVHAEHELARHADLDAHVGVAATDLLDRAQRGEEVAVAGRPGGVEVHAVGAGLGHRVGDEEHVARGVLGGLFLGGRASAILPSGMSSDQFGTGPSGCE